MELVRRPHPKKPDSEEVPAHPRLQTDMDGEPYNPHRVSEAELYTKWKEEGRPTSPDSYTLADAQEGQGEAVEIPVAMAGFGMDGEPTTAVRQAYREQNHGGLTTDNPTPSQQFVPSARGRQVEKQYKETPTESLAA